MILQFKLVCLSFALSVICVELLKNNWIYFHEILYWIVLSMPAGLHAFLHTYNLQDIYENEKCSEKL